MRRYFRDSTGLSVQAMFPNNFCYQNTGTNTIFGLFADGFSLPMISGIVPGARQYSFPYRSPTRVVPDTIIIIDETTRIVIAIVFRGERRS